MADEDNARTRRARRGRVNWALSVDEAGHLHTLSTVLTRPAPRPRGHRERGARKKPAPQLHRTTSAGRVRYIASRLLLWHRHSTRSSRHLYVVLLCSRWRTHEWDAETDFWVTGRGDQVWKIYTWPERLRKPRRKSTVELRHIHAEALSSRCGPVWRAFTWLGNLGYWAISGLFLGYFSQSKYNWHTLWLTY